MVKSAVEDTALRLNKQEIEFLDRVCKSGALVQDHWPVIPQLRRFWRLGLVTITNLSRETAWYYPRQWTVRPTLFGHRVSRHLKNLLMAALA